ncbi:hypothetical protein [Heyndrickxia oleronia]|uniref:hypothetical protein n=1 Tax=Heyndrickxia oleronia TaxID=38875 RepID=UPI0037504548
MNDPKELVVKVVELTGSNYQIGGLQAEQLRQESNWNGPYQNMEKNPDFNCFQASLSNHSFFLDNEDRSP